MSLTASSQSRSGLRSPVRTFNDHPGDDLGGGIGSVCQAKLMQRGFVSPRHGLDGAIVECCALQGPMDYHVSLPSTAATMTRNHEGVSVGLVMKRFQNGPAAIEGATACHSASSRLNDGPAVNTRRSHFD